MTTIQKADEGGGTFGVSKYKNDDKIADKEGSFISQN